MSRSSSNFGTVALLALAALLFYLWKNQQTPNAGYSSGSVSSGGGTKSQGGPFGVSFNAMGGPPVSRPGEYTGSMLAHPVEYVDPTTLSQHIYSFVTAGKFGSIGPMENEGGDPMGFGGGPGGGKGEGISKRFDIVNTW